jgi:hypothetical protein
MVLAPQRGPRNPSPDLVPRPPSPHGRGKKFGRAGARRDITALSGEKVAEVRSRGPHVLLVVGMRGLSSAPLRAKMISAFSLGEKVAEGRMRGLVGGSPAARDNGDQALGKDQSMSEPAVAQPRGDVRPPGGSEIDHRGPDTAPLGLGAFSGPLTHGFAVGDTTSRALRAESGGPELEKQESSLS